MLTTAQTVEALQTNRADLAAMIASNEYVLWVGSGISRDRVPGLDVLVERVVSHIQAKATAAGPGADGPYVAALHEVLDVTDLTGGERGRVDVRLPFRLWRHHQRIERALVNRYSELLEIGVEGEETDWLLWDGIDPVSTYGPGSARADIEHMSIAILVLERAFTRVMTPNWDCLIEDAVASLVPEPASKLRVIVTGADARGSEHDSKLYKFHGCASRAGAEPDVHRGRLIAQRHQITGYATNDDYEVTRHEVLGLVMTQRLVISGLSINDDDILAMLIGGSEPVGRKLSDAPPSPVVVADQALSPAQRSLLVSMYKTEGAAAVATAKADALLPVYAKPFFAALALQVLALKLIAAMRIAVDTSLSPTDGADLAELLRARFVTAAGEIESAPRPTARRYLDIWTRALAVFRGRHYRPVDTTGELAPEYAYQPLSNQPLNGEDEVFSDNGVADLAASLALLVDGDRAGHWSLSLPPAGHGNSVIDASRAGRSYRIFFVGSDAAITSLLANPSFGVTLASDDVVVIQGPSVRRPAPRSHVSARRTGAPPGLRMASIQELLDEAGSRDELVDLFLKDVAL